MGKILSYDNEKTLRGARKVEGLTQEELSEQAQITQGQISGVERGERLLHWAFAARAASPLPVSPTDLFINQNMWAAEKKLTEKRMDLDVLEEEVEEFAGWRGYADPREKQTKFREGVILHGNILDIAHETRSEINNIFQAFGKYWLSISEMKGETQVKKMMTEAQKTIDRTLNLVEQLEMDSTSIHLFRLSLDRKTDDPSLTYEAKHRSKEDDPESEAW